MAVRARWLRRLATPNAQLAERAGRGGGYAVYAGSDRRRRPLALVTQAQFNTAMAEGLLKRRGQAYCLVGQSDRPAGSSSGQVLESHALALPDGSVEHCSVNASETPLYPWRDWLSSAELEAGERLRSDYALSNLNQRVTQSWSPVSAPRGQNSWQAPEDAPVRVLAAKDRVFAALDAVGPGLDRILFAICIREEPMGDVERQESWARSTGRTVLKIALARLAEHYGANRS